MDVSSVVVELFVTQAVSAIEMESAVQAGTSEHLETENQTTGIVANDSLIPTSSKMAKIVKKYPDLERILKDHGSQLMPELSDTERERLDQTHLYELDPAWLEQYPNEEQKQSAFLRRILPLLALRVYPDVDKLNNSLKPIEVPVDPWLHLFEELKFDLATAVERYHDSPQEHLIKLNQYMILKRARIMVEKLWRNCAEFYLSGLAYSCSRLPGKACLYTTAKYGEPSSLTNAQMYHLKICCPRLDAEHFQYLCRRQRLESVSTEIPEHSNCTDCDAEHLDQWGSDQWHLKMLRANVAHFFRMRDRYRQTYRNNRDGTGNPFDDIDLERWKKILALGDGLESGKKVEKGVWKCYKEGPSPPYWGVYSGNEASEWSRISLNVRAFCVQAGKIAPVVDVLQNVAELRKFNAVKMIHGGQLSRENQELRENTKIMRRSIAALAYRHLMENLPGDALAKKLDPTKEDKNNSTKEWKNFWQEAWAEAKRGNSTSPLASVYRKLSHHNDRNHIEKTGPGLFGMLSRVIHGHNHGYDFAKDIDVDPVLREVIAALRPDESNIDKEGNVDWKREKKRFLPSEGGVNSDPRAPTQGVKKEDNANKCVKLKEDESQGKYLPSDPSSKREERAAQIKHSVEEVGQNEEYYSSIQGLFGSGEQA